MAGPAADPVAELEQAILDQAQRLAEEFRQRAERTRDTILREASEKLRLREEREVLVAKAQAERAYRQQVQASELRLRSELDRTRWNLVAGVMERLGEEAAALAADEGRYLPLLAAFLRQGAELLPGEALVAELNARDRRRLAEEWPRFVAGAVAGLARAKRIELAPEPIETAGGVRLATPDGRIRIDHTFEGRRERLARQLHQAIGERLLPASGDDATLFTG